MKIGEYSKAITAALVTFGLAYNAATAPGSVGQDGVTSAEWVGVAVGTIVAGLSVFLVPNTPPATQTSTVTLETSRTGPEGYVGEHAPR